MLKRKTGIAGIVAAAFLLASPLVLAATSPVTLTGAQEVPAVTTSATGDAKITVGADKSVSGTITTTGIAGTMAHIHMGALGKNGKVLVNLEKTSDNVWSVPANTKLTDEQYKMYQDGELYVNVHSADHKSGEIRAQLKP
jgi:hypothetical protein